MRDLLFNPPSTFWTSSSGNRGQYNALRCIDNYIRNEYTGNHYDHDGDSKPRTKYGQVSVPSPSYSRHVVSVNKIFT